MGAKSTCHSMSGCTDYTGFSALELSIFKGLKIKTSTNVGCVVEWEGLIHP